MNEPTEQCKCRIVIGELEVCYCAHQAEIDGWCRGCHDSPVCQSMQATPAEALG